MRPELARAGKTALDLVVDEDGADFIAAVTEALEELRRGDVDAAFALDGFDDDAAGFFGDELIYAVFVVVCAVLKARDHGCEGFLVFRVWCRGQASHSPAMEGTLEGDDFMFGT